MIHRFVSHRLNPWLMRHGWALWFEQEQRLPDEYAPDHGPCVYKMVPAGRRRMKLRRYP